MYSRASVCDGQDIFLQRHNSIIVTVTQLCIIFCEKIKNKSDQDVQNVLVLLISPTETTIVSERVRPLGVLPSTADQNYAAETQLRCLILALGRMFDQMHKLATKQIRSRLVKM